MSYVKYKWHKFLFGPFGLNTTKFLRNNKIFKKNPVYIPAMHILRMTFFSRSECKTRL